MTISLSRYCLSRYCLSRCCVWDCGAQVTWRRIPSPVLNSLTYACVRGSSWQNNSQALRYRKKVNRQQRLADIWVSASMDKSEQYRPQIKARHTVIIIMHRHTRACEHTHTLLHPSHALSLIPYTLPHPSHTLSLIPPAHTQADHGCIRWRDWETYELFLSLSCDLQE